MKSVLLVEPRGGVGQPWSENNAHLYAGPFEEAGFTFSVARGGIPHNLSPDLVIWNLGFYPFEQVWDLIGKRDYVSIVQIESLSTGHLSGTKDFLKAAFRPRVDAFVVLNEGFRTRLRLNASKPIFVRPMGFDQGLAWSASQTAVKEFDFVYAGSVTRAGVLGKLREIVCSGWSLLILGAEPGVIADMAPDLEGSEKVRLGGIVLDRGSYFREVARARIGVNFTPDIEPWNLQDSTKTLEYAALGLSVLSNRYTWSAEFMRTYEVSHSWFEDWIDRSQPPSFSVQGSMPIGDLAWDSVLRRSGMVEWAIGALGGKDRPLG